MTFVTSQSRCNATTNLFDPCDFYDVSCVNDGLPGMETSMNSNVTEAVIDGVIATSQEALALSLLLRERGQDELAALWGRFAEYLIASEAYVGLTSPGLS